MITMVGKPRALCLIAPEEVWARAREDYENGMTGGAVAAKHGIGVSGLRGRAHREGWTKRAAAARRAGEAPALAVVETAALSEPLSLEPQDIVRGALARASATLLAGRPAEATAILGALSDVLPWAEALADADAADDSLEAVLDRRMDMLSQINAYAERLAEQMLGDGEVFERNAPFAFAWRARRLGPEAAERDRAYAERMGWTDRLYDAEGRLRGSD
jgi:hypothetical protein